MMALQNMAFVETITSPLLPVVPLMQDIQYQPQDSYQESMLEDIQIVSGKNPEKIVHTKPENPPTDSQEMAQSQETGHPETQSYDSPGFATYIPETAIHETLQESVQNTIEQDPEDQPPHLESGASTPKSIVPIQEDLSCLGKVSFDPSKHIQFMPPTKVWTMKELGYEEDQGISPVGVSEPFPLFSPEAVKQMRAEILSENVWQKYKFSSNLSDCMLRGYAPE